MEDRNHISAFVSFGFTSNQARVYLSLLQSGIADAKAISVKSGVERSETYRIIAHLEKAGLIERILSSPSKFKAIPMEIAFAILLEKRSEETAKLKSETEKLLRIFSETNLHAKSAEEETHFIMFPRKSASVLRRRKAIENAQIAVDVVTSAKRAPAQAFAYFEAVKGALARNVEFRIITDSIPNFSRIPEFTDLGQAKHYQIRFVTFPLPTLFSLYDKKEVLMTLSPSAYHGESPTLWSDNPSFVTMAQQHFEALWQMSTEAK